MKHAHTLLRCLSLMFISIIFSFTSAQSQQFTGNEEHKITLDEAKTLVKNFRVDRPNEQLKAGYFGKDALLELLSQPGVVGLRIYKGKKTDGNENYVLVGVDATGADIVTGTILERTAPCPPFCDPTSEFIK